jgi:hypothetical protein
MCPVLQHRPAAPVLRRVLSLAAVLLAGLAGAAVAAEPPRVALVLANGRVAVAGIAPVPACPASARAIGRRLSELNFDLVQSIDAGRGETEVAIAGFAARLRSAPAARAVVYICGTFAEIGGRAFLLPASAVLDRPLDLLTQGVLLRGLPDILTQAGIGAGLIALDAFAADGLAHLPSLPALPNGDAVALVASSQAERLRQPTALAQALLRELQEPAAGGGDLGSIATRLHASLADLPGGGQSLGLPPARAATLLEGTMSAATEAPQPPQPPAAEVPPTMSPPTTPPVAVPAIPPSPAPVAGASPAGTEAAAEPPAPPSPAPPAFAGEPPLSEADRRGIQTTLTMLGYYRERVDGAFGPGTRAAIRRYQAEIGAAPSGALTAGQARRLLTAAGSRRP